MKNMQLNKGVVIPKMDMYELFERYREELTSGTLHDNLNNFYERFFNMKGVLTSGTLHDDLKNSRSPMRLTNMMVSYSEESRALRFQCDEGTVTLCICDKPNGDDTIYYRPADAPKGVGFGTPVWTISENGDKFIRNNEAIEKTDIGFSSDVVGKQAIFSTVISHLRNFRSEYVPPSVIAKSQEQEQTADNFEDNTDSIGFNGLD